MNESDVKRWELCPCDILRSDCPTHRAPPVKLYLDDLERKARACQVEIEYDGEWFLPERDDAEWLLGSSVVTTSKSPRPLEAGGRVLVQANTNFPSEATLGHIAAASPPVVLALIARIREVERALRVVSDPNLVGDVTRRSVLEILAKGAVLP